MLNQIYPNSTQQDIRVAVYDSGTSAMALDAELVAGNVTDIQWRKRDDASWTSLTPVGSAGAGYVRADSPGSVDGSGIMLITLPTAAATTRTNLMVRLIFSDADLSHWTQMPEPVLVAYQSIIDSSGRVDIGSISGDSTAADNLEAACDGTGYNLGNGSIVAASVTDKTGYSLANNSITSSVVASNAFNNSAFTTGFYNAINSEVDTAFADYDPPTKAELDAGLAALNDITAADVYTQFTSGSNEDAFKADVSGLATQASVDTIDGIVDAILEDTGELQSNQGQWVTATSVTVSDKTGFSLAPTGLDSISITAPSGVATNFREMVVQVWRRFFKRATATSTEIRTYADDGTTTITTQTVSDNGTTQDQGAAS